MTKEKQVLEQKPSPENEATMPQSAKDFQEKGETA
ncbi:hypothetical protein LCGC14_2940270 [marine sediment metagenome]|uniref:Uncharacterized protein n=1 Tax=marine sediment metagenome TaxID=412755 RepID=A0A0F9A9B7_9ZZZZ